MSSRSVTQQIRDEFYLIGAWLGDGTSSHKLNSDGDLDVEPTFEAGGKSP